MGSGATAAAPAAIARAASHPMVPVSDPVGGRSPPDAATVVDAAGGSVVGVGCSLVGTGGSVVVDAAGGSVVGVGCSMVGTGGSVVVTTGVSMITVTAVDALFAGLGSTWGRSRRRSRRDRWPEHRLP